MNIDTHLPYHVEYARTSRSKCKGCFKSIYEGEVRIAVLVQSHWNNGKMPQWYHCECFFAEQKLRSTKALNGFKDIRKWDRLDIKTYIDMNKGPDGRDTDKEDEEDEDDEEDEEDETDEEEFGY